MKQYPQKTLFKPIHKEKYSGDVNAIICRSSWERKICNYLDLNQSVEEWSSEEIVIPYLNPLDNKVHRYFPDFTAKIRQKDGNLKTFIIEVKPHAQTQQPEFKKRKTKKYLHEAATYLVNEAKWKAAKHYCMSSGFEFLILTEKMTKF